MVGSIGGLVGALLTARITRRIRYGPAIIGGVALLYAGALGFAVVQGPPAITVPLLALAWFLVAVGNVINNAERGTADPGWVYFYARGVGLVAGLLVPVEDELTGRRGGLILRIG